MPTLVVGMVRRHLAIHMPTASVGMPPSNLPRKTSSLSCIFGENRHNNGCGGSLIQSRGWEVCDGQAYRTCDAIGGR